MSVATANGSAEVILKPARRLRPGSYALTLRTRYHHHLVVQRIHITLG